MVVVAVCAAIGCGGSAPQDASARTEETISSERPMQLAQALAIPVQAAGSGGLIRGTVTLNGAAPKAKQIKMGADPVCQLQHTEAVYAENVIVNENGMLRNVFVYVKEGVSGSYDTPTEPVVLNQVGCRYVPHVAGIQVNQSLQITNSDGTLHNINAKPTVNRPFNIAQPVQGMKTSKKFTKPEVMVRFKCNVHPWMNAYLGVVSHPFYAVSGDDGGFTVSGLPDGTYQLEAWHETYGTQSQSVTVSGGQAPAVSFTFNAS